MITQIILNKMSKGSKRRPEKGTQYQDNWERIFGNKNNASVDDLLDAYNEVLDKHLPSKKSKEKKCKTMKRSMKKQR